MVANHNIKLDAARFAALMAGFPDIHEGGEVALAVSGGPDSMALCALMHEWAKPRDIALHFLSVDHGLRPEAADEAAFVSGIVGDWGKHVTLRWDVPADLDSKIQEEARRARYDLMAEYCAAHEVRHLFLAHHIDDQAETVLFRLAKGSGLDGLCGMAARQEHDSGLFLCRPLLPISKDQLIRVCEASGLEYINDPSNKNENFARVRLRAAKEVLESEGLTSKRLLVTSQRLRRAQEALDYYTDELKTQALLEKDTKCIEYKLQALTEKPFEIIVRLVLQCFDELACKREYAPRMEKVEALVHDLMNEGGFRKRTLGGLIFEVSGEKFIISVE